VKIGDRVAVVEPYRVPAGVEPAAPGVVTSFIPRLALIRVEWDESSGSRIGTVNAPYPPDALRPVADDEAES